MAAGRVLLWRVGPALEREFGEAPVRSQRPDQLDWRGHDEIVLVVPDVRRFSEQRVDSGVAHSSGPALAPAVVDEAERVRLPETSGSVEVGGRSS